MRLARLCLKLTVLLVAYMLIVLAVKHPAVLFFYGLFLLVRRKRRNNLAAYGTSRWADSSDLGGLIDE